MEPELISRSQRYFNLAVAFCPPQAGAPRDLELAYTRLFLGPGRPIAQPYESVHVEGRLMGEAAAQVAACYAEAGLHVNIGVSELPDHVSLELAFMAHLAAQEEHDPDRGAVWRDRQRRFLLEHLARWLPQLWAKIERSEAHPYYREAARAAKELVQEDVARLTSPFTEPESRSFTRPEFSKPAPRKRSQIQDSNFSLAVDLSLCTLCVLCTENCRSGALTAVCTPTTLHLEFDAATCNGCRACLRLCPEGAIAITRVSAHVAPPSTATDGTRTGRGTVVVTASRVVCPECHRPHIAEPWLERLVERLGGAESARRSLALCPLCKSGTGKDGSVADGSQHGMYASA